MGDILSAWTAISNGVVDQNNKKREKYWKHWSEYVTKFKANPYLSNCSKVEQIIIITSFAARVRAGHYGRGSIVKVQSVKDALAAISKTIELAGEYSPIYKADKTYKVPVARLIEGYKREDPPSTPQIAIPVEVADECQNSGFNTKDSKLQALGALSTMAFFFLLRVGEYTKPKYCKKNGETKRATRTVQFTVNNIGFFKDNNILPRNSNLKTLLTADSCTLKITNQKNGHMGQTIHQHATNTNFCPVKAAAHRVNHILSHHGKDTALICD